MRKCNERCKPCCDFCRYVVHEMVEVNGRPVPLEPLGCSLYLDAYHQRLAVRCQYCESFVCRSVED